MIYDCFLFSGERDVLKIRCEELKPLGVVHVLVEGRNTFTGNAKKLRYPDIEHEFNKYNIRYIIVDDVSVSFNPWDEESNQRNAIMRGLYDAKEDDIVIISDVDEIPYSKCVAEYDIGMGITAFRMDNFWYKFNWLTGGQAWTPAKILSFCDLKKSTPNEIRNGGAKSEFSKGGWHFSYLGDADYIVEKLESFSHIEFNLEKYKNKEEIRQKIKDGISLWGGSQFEYVTIDESFPKYLYENKKEFSHLIKDI